MSRIHEALKKAEQERAALGTPAGSGGPQPVDETDGTTLRPVEEIGPAVSAQEYSGGVPLTAAMPSFASPFSLDALLARCAPQPWKPETKTMLFFNGDDAARGTEEFRTLRSRLYHMREKMPLKKILITSALPKEGKSFTAANLAQVLVRQHGRRVLLVDADLRAPRLLPAFPTTCREEVTSFPFCSGVRWRAFSSCHAARKFRIPPNWWRTGGCSCSCSGWSLCLIGSSSIPRLRFRFPMPAFWRRLATAC